VVFHLGKADDEVANSVAGLPFVFEAKAIDSKLLVTLDDPELHNPDIIRLLVNAGIDVQFVGELRRSLEDVYLQLVKSA
jgi:ABC-2 type transport system ATP-binding protein